MLRREHFWRCSLRASASVFVTEFKLWQVIAEVKLNTEIGELFRMILVTTAHSECF